MAINFLEKPYDKINSNSFKENNSSSSQLLKNGLPVDENQSISDVKIKKNKNARSPYLFGDSVQLLSRVTENKLVHKKAANVTSSFPLAVNIYKASSDEFKAQKKGTKSVKKSVLTLPNVPAQIPQACTVSDMNDSEYLKTNADSNKFRSKKCFATQNRKVKVRNKAYGRIERDASFCSQLNINADDVTGDSKKKSKHSNKTKAEKEFSSHDMWTVLRNINKFQFRPSPPMSDDSINSQKKKKYRNKRRNNRNDTRVVETCRTEEFAYISSFEIDNKSPPSFSQSLSFDRITVIDKQDEFKDICTKIGRSIENGNIRMKNEHLFTTNKNFTKGGFNINDKAITYKNNKHLTSSKKNYNGRKLLSDKTEYLIKGNMIEYSLGRNSRVGDARSKKSESHLFGDYHNKDFNEICDQFNEFDDIPSHSLQSGSSKVYVNHMTMTANEHMKRDNAKVHVVPSNESAQNMKGITKVILSKNLNLNGPNHSEVLKKRPNVAVIPQNSITTPKLTHTDIKRRLANIKFPIIILGKDQLATTSINVPNNKHIQFDGLDKQIWPYMEDWYAPKNGPVNQNIDEKNTKNKYLLDNSVKFKQILPSESKHKHNCEIIEDKLNKDAMNKKKTLRKPLKPSELNKIHMQQPIRPKPVKQLTDKMIKLLYKNSSVRSIDTGHGDIKQNDNNISTSELKKLSVIVKADASTETTRMDDCISESNKSSIDIKKTMLATYPWARGKRSSEFVDTVIKRIRNGVYYNEEVLRRIIPIDCKEVSVQTSMSDKNIQVNDVAIQDERIVKDNKSINCFELTSLDYIDTLPVFGESPPPFEVKTLNRNELSIKHCTTNVMLKFDVTISMESDIDNPLTNNSTFIPISITESHTKIFKCKTTILNAMLPAEICSVLPRLLKTVVNLNKQPLQPLKSYQNDTNLYKISELSRGGSMEEFKCAIPSVIWLSSTLTTLMDGMYAHRLSQIRKKGKYKKLRLNLRRHSVVDVLLPIQSAQQLVLAKVNDMDPIMPKSMPMMPPKIENKCTALEVYKAPIKSITEQNIPLSGTCSITNIIKQMWNQKFSIRFKIAMPLNAFYEDNAITVNIQVDNVAAKTVDSSSVNQLQIDPLFNRCNNSNGYKTHCLLSNSAYKAIEYKQSTIKEKTDQKDIRGFLSNTKTRKKSFVKLYKKCKSTSNIAGEKYSTSLSKITNLDDFFQVLGSGKMLSSIFDGHVGKKILSALLDMKNWITDISQRQAMLVLLLINKKDTPNLVRFRPILLQGIAVNRITRASELDMEIEVIEREHFNKFIQYDGISYLQENVENQGNLLEELYWIAKTTASDYQKPFNESSEKLLRSLLEKRKKLNPSYLRVMARYVGLGLLKQPVKK